MSNDYPLSEKLDHPDILSQLFFPRSDANEASPPLSHDHRIVLEKSGITLFCRLHLCELNAPTILYFHGNGEVVADYDPICSLYTKAGLNVFMATYRGYGKSTGSPSATALLSDNSEIKDYLRNYLVESGMSDELFVMGRSLGSASAIDLAFKAGGDFKGLILDSPFAHTIALAERLGIDCRTHDLREEECFNNLEKIRAITIPTLILHGALDQIIPVAEPGKLQADSGAKTKQFHIIPGADHNSLIGVGGPLYFETIKKFVDSVTGKNTWRQRRRAFKNKGSS